jgi:hypothetical protein
LQALALLGWLILCYLAAAVGAVASVNALWSWLWRANPGLLA